MTQPCRILLVEDSPEDYEIIRYNLKKGGLDADIVRVETESEYVERLAAGGVDVVLSDANLPRFSGREALEVRNRLAPLVPFILVSGAVGDEMAVEFLRNGCVDYVLKEKLTRLPSAVTRAVEEAVSKAERSRAQEAVAESEARFRRMADNSPMFIWMMDPEGNPTFMNAPFCRYLGRPVGTVENMDWTTTMHPDDVQRVMTAYREGIEARKTFTVEYRLRNSLGEYRWILDTTAPNYLPSGEYIGYLGSAVDIHDRKVAEEALRESEQKFRSLFDHHAAVKLLVDAQTGAIVDANRSAEQYYGWPQSVLTAMTVVDLNLDPPEAVRRRMQDVLDRRRNSFVTRHRRSDGTVRDVEVFSTLIDIRNRSILYSIVIDITDKVRSEERLRLNDAALNSAKNAMMIADTQGTIEWVNPAFTELTGYSTEEALGRNPRDLVRSGRHDRAFYTALWSTILAGRVWHGELVNRRKDGTLYDEEQTITPIRGADGAVTHFISVKQDITERKRMEESLRRSTEMLDTFFHQSLDACFYMELRHPIDWTDDARRGAMMEDVYETARIVKVNDALLRQFRISRDAVMRLNPRAMFDEDFEKTARLFTKLFDTGAMYYSTTMRREDDKSEMVLEGNAVCIRDGQGRITGFFGIQRDVTDEHREREELQRNEERYRRFFEEDMTGDFITRPDGTIVMCNPSFARIFGYPSAEHMLTLNARELYADPDERVEWLRTIKRDRKVDRYMLRGRRSDGSEFVALMTAIANFNPAGDIVEMVGYITDDSRRQEMESQMIQAQKMESIGELASGVAHDFNNILNNILGFSQQLVKYHGDPARVLRYTDTIVKSANRGTEIASKLLAFARRRKPDLSVISLTDVIADVLQMCRDTFMHVIELESDIAPDLWKVQGDRSSVYQMLLNICMNSRDAMADGLPGGRRGQLRFEARNQTAVNPDLHWFRQTPPSRCVEIVIRDNGPGLPSGIIDRIFDPFFSTKTQNGQKGTGLGLTVVYNIVKTHHGAVQVRSEEGKGAEFRLFIPAVEYVGADQETGNVERFRSQFNELVLLVDDEEGMRDMGSEILEESGYRVVTAATGAEAVEIFRQRHNDIALVILDLVLPDIDGGQTFLKMKTISPSFKAFFCSGFVTQSVITNLLAEENLGALQKPFRQEQFLKFVFDTLYGQ